MLAQHPHLQQQVQVQQKQLLRGHRRRPRRRAAAAAVVVVAAALLLVLVTTPAARAAASTHDGASAPASGRGSSPLAPWWQQLVLQQLHRHQRSLLGEAKAPPPAPAARQPASSHHQQQQQQQQKQLLAAAAPTTPTLTTPAATPATLPADALARWQAWHARRQAAAAAAAPLPPEPDDMWGVTIPRPPPGVDVPAERQPPLFSPDQLRLRHKPLPGVPLEQQLISIAEQLQQAAALGQPGGLTDAQLEDAAPLLGASGPVAVPERSGGPADWPDGYLALCAIVKDQGRELREWLEYHRWLGVGKVYVYDNNSTAPLAAGIADLLHSGFAEYAFFTGQPRYRDLFRTSSQWWAYNDCARRFRHRHRWLGFIDVDEFIVLQGADAAPSQTRPSGQGDMAQRQDKQQQQPEQQQHEQGAGGGINAFLRGYEAFGGLALNWVIFGSSGHVARPAGGVLANYHACLPGGHEQNAHVKVLANTAHLLSVGDDPHRVVYRTPGAATVNELRQPLTQARSAAPSHTRVALYHYLTKSAQEYATKMARGSAAGNYKAPEFFATIDALATATCTRGLRLGLECCPSVAAELGPAGVAALRARHAALVRQQQQQEEEAGGAGLGTAPGTTPGSSSSGGLL